MLECTKHGCTSGCSALSQAHWSDTAVWLQDMAPAATESTFRCFTARPAHRALCGKRYKLGRKCSRTEVEDVEIGVIHQVKFITHSLLWRWAAETKHSVSVSAKIRIHQLTKG